MRNPHLTRTLLASLMAAAFLSPAFAQRDDALLKAATDAQPAVVKTLEQLVNIETGTGDAEGMAAAEWAALQARAKSVIMAKVYPSYQAFADLYEREIKGKCRQTVGVSSMPQGPEYYAFQVRQQTTTGLTPDEIRSPGGGAPCA